MTETEAISVNGMIGFVIMMTFMSIPIVVYCTYKLVRWVGVKRGWF